MPPGSGIVVINAARQSQQATAPASAETQFIVFCVTLAFFILLAVALYIWYIHKSH